MSPGRGKTKGKKKHAKKKKHPVRGDLKTVTLSDCSATPSDTLQLSRGNGDEVQWTSGDGGTYAIVFYTDPPTYPDVSPFHDSVFVVRPNGTTPSGPIRKDADYVDYKYRVVGDDGCDVDPVIHIGP